MSATQQLIDAAAKRSEAANLQQLGLHDQAITTLRDAAAIYTALDETPTEAEAETLDALSALLRTQGQVADALAPAERALTLVTKLAHADGPRYLPLLARATDNLGRCCQQLRHYERAAATYEQAVSAHVILAELGAAEDRLRLAEVMSRHALALAQLGQLDQAERVAARFVALGRELLPRSLPLLAGGLSFMADLAEDLGRPADRVAHLADAVCVLERAEQQDLPGAGEAASRLRETLREASDRARLPVPPE